MENKTCLGLLIILIIIIIIVVLIYKHFSIIEEEKVELETFLVPTTTLPTVPTTTSFDISKKVKNKLESRYDEILQSQYENIKKQQELDDLTDRLNMLNSELQKHINSYMKYQTTGELNFY